LTTQQTATDQAVQQTGDYTVLAQQPIQDAIAAEQVATGQAITQQTVQQAGDHTVLAQQSVEQTVAVLSAQQPAKQITAQQATVPAPQHDQHASDHTLSPPHAYTNHSHAAAHT